MIFYCRFTGEFSLEKLLTFIELNPEGEGLRKIKIPFQYEQSQWILDFQAVNGYIERLVDEATFFSPWGFEISSEESLA